MIFPNLESGNIAYKLLQQLGGGEVLGPFIMGLKRPANIVARDLDFESSAADNCIKVRHLNKCCWAGGQYQSLFAPHLPCIFEPYIRKYKV